ncbi:MAG: hypothetical protein ACKO11_08475 [Cuspidothrix sp.]
MFRYRSQPPNYKRSHSQHPQRAIAHYPNFKRSHSHIPKQRSHTTLILNDRTPTSQTAIPTERFAIAHKPNFKRSLSQPTS